MRRPTEREKLLENKGHGQEGWARIEAKPLGIPTVHLAAEVAVLFNQGDTVAPAGQAEGCGDSPETAADHDYMFHPAWTSSASGSSRRCRGCTKNRRPYGSPP